MNTTEALARLDDEAPEMEATLLAWCAQNSGSHHLEGLAHMHGMLAEAFSAALEAPAEHLDLEPGKRGAALRLRKHPEAPVQVLCSGHMDTVFGPESPFQDCTRLPDGRLRGPGTADMKGGLLIMLKALETLERSSLAGQVGWTVVITADEELGSDGSAALLAEEAARHALGLVFESSLPAGDLIGERSGIGSFRAVAHGRAAHTGRDPAAGRNAIVHLARWVDEVEQLAATFPGLQANLGAIRGGGPLNVVPARAEAEWSLRLPAAIDPATVEAALAERRAAFDTADGLRLEWDGGFTRPPMALTPAREHLLAAYRDCAGALGQSLAVRHTGGTSDGNLLAAAGLPVLDGIGPRGGDLHQESEFILPESLVERSRLAALFLLRLASGEIPPGP